jgi:hypothetical protein
MLINCRVEGCPSTIEISNATSGTKYLCSKHPEHEQNKMIGRKRRPQEEVSFQEYQFDPDLRRSGKSEGTTHVRRQGNDTDDFARTQEIDLMMRNLI